MCPGPVALVVEDRGTCTVHLCPACGMTWSVKLSQTNGCRGEAALEPLTEQGREVWLAAIEARHRAATKGPWYARMTDDEVFMNACYISTKPGSGGTFRHDGGQGMAPGTCDAGSVVAITLLQSPLLANVADEKWDENTEFIAHAWADVRDLSRELRVAWAEIKRLQRLVPKPKPNTNPGPYVQPLLPGMEETTDD